MKHLHLAAIHPQCTSVASVQSCSYAVLTSTAKSHSTFDMPSTPVGHGMVLIDTSQHVTLPVQVVYGTE